MYSQSLMWADLFLALLSLLSSLLSFFHSVFFFFYLFASYFLCFIHTSTSYLTPPHLLYLCFSLIHIILLSKKHPKHFSSVIGNYIAEVTQTDESHQLDCLGARSGPRRENVGVIIQEMVLHEQESLSAPLNFFSSPLTLSAITVLHSLSLSTGRQTLKSFLIMRETTEKRLKMHTHRLKCMHTHRHALICTHVRQLRKGYIKKCMNFKQNASAWLPLIVCVYMCVWEKQVYMWQA